jgi:SAM-dependent methyltransferase
MRERSYHWRARATTDGSGTIMGEARRTFTPAAGHDWLLPLYDPLLRWMGVESALRELVERADLRPGQRILDVGCGTGNLVVLIKRLHAETDVVGLDPDPKALARAGRKAERAGASVQLDRGFSDQLPYADGAFDRVFSTFMFHHLELPEKRRTLLEVRRVLAPGGSLHLIDFGGASARADGLLARLLHRTEHLAENLEGRIPVLMHEAGLEDASEVAERSTLVGRICHYRADSPSAVPSSGAA